MPISRPNVRAMCTDLIALPSAGASVQAIATVRIISGVRLSFGANQSDASAPRPRLTIIHTADAQEQPAKLFEFE